MYGIQKYVLVILSYKLGGPYSSQYGIVTGEVVPRLASLHFDIPCHCPSPVLHTHISFSCHLPCII